MLLKLSQTATSAKAKKDVSNNVKNTLSSFMNGGNSGGESGNNGKGLDGRHGGGIGTGSGYSLKWKSSSCKTSTKISM